MRKLEICYRRFLGETRGVEQELSQSAQAASIQQVERAGYQEWRV